MGRDKEMGLDSDGECQGLLVLVVWKGGVDGKRHGWHQQLGVRKERLWEGVHGESTSFILP